MELVTATWKIPAERMKMKIAHIVPLSTQSLAVLNELHKLTGPGGYLFPSIRLFDRCGVELLPQLKKIAALKSQVAHGRVTADQVERLEIMRKAKPSLRRCGPSVSMDPGFEFDVGFADAVSLDILNAAIDGYLDDRENQNRFVYAQFSYESHNFLATAAPGQRAVKTTPASFKEAVDRASGWTPSFALIEIDKATYDRGVTCTYAFKAFKEMNKPCNE